MKQMKNYIGTKEIQAMPMNRLDYNKYRGWSLPSDENGEDEGYLVEYKGDSSNHIAHEGYISWSPKKQFEEAYLEPIAVDITKSDFPHEQRVIEEASELLEKFNKLKVFIEENPFFLKLPKEEQNRLETQALVMRQYHSVLSHRIENFKLVDPNKENVQNVDRELTFGEKAVGVSFNSSKIPEVDAIKANFAQLIDLMEENKFNTRLGAMLKTEAQMNCVRASMSIVKLLTFTE